MFWRRLSLKIVSINVVVFFCFMSMSEAGRLNKKVVADQKLTPRMSNQDLAELYNRQHYDRNYAERYMKAVAYFYTLLKNTILADQIKEIVGTKKGRKLRVLDVGGNINAIAISGLWDLMRERGLADQTSFVGLDLNPAYFDSRGNAAYFPEKILSSDASGLGIVGDIGSSPIRDESVDIAVIADVLEHLPDLDKVMKALNKLLAPNGDLLIVIPAFYKLDEFKYPYIRNKRETSHLHFFNARENLIFSLLEKFGFKVEEKYGIGYMTAFPYLLWSHINYVPDNQSSPTEREKVYKSILKVLESCLSVEDGLKIDENLRKSENIFDDPRLKMIEAIKRDVRNVLYLCCEALKFHPDYEMREDLQKAYKQIRKIIDQVIDSFSDGSVKGRLDYLWRELSRPEFFRLYGGNSLFIHAKKIEPKVDLNREKRFRDSVHSKLMAELKALFPDKKVFLHNDDVIVSDTDKALAIKDDIETDEVDLNYSIYFGDRFRKHGSDRVVISLKEQYPGFEVVSVDDRKPEVAGATWWKCRQKRSGPEKTEEILRQITAAMKEGRRRVVVQFEGREIFTLDLQKLKQSGALIFDMDRTLLDKGDEDSFDIRQELREQFHYLLMNGIRVRIVSSNLQSAIEKKIVGPLRERGTQLGNFKVYSNGGGLLARYIGSGTRVNRYESVRVDLISKDDIAKVKSLLIAFAKKRFWFFEDELSEVGDYLESKQGEGRNPQTFNYSWSDSDLTWKPDVFSREDILEQEKVTAPYIELRQEGLSIAIRLIPSAKPTLSISDPSMRSVIQIAKAS